MSTELAFSESGSSPPSVKCSLPGCSIRFDPRPISPKTGKPRAGSPRKFCTPAHRQAEYEQRTGGGPARESGEYSVIKVARDDKDPSGVHVTGGMPTRRDRTTGTVQKPLRDFEGDAQPWASPAGYSEGLAAMLRERETDAVKAWKRRQALAWLRGE